VGLSSSFWYSVLMFTKEFDYTLPPDLIAKTPLAKRDSSKLMVIKTKEDNFSHKSFSDIESHLGANDVLVLNDTKVIKARLFAYKKTGAKIELFLINPLNDTDWVVLMRPAKRVSVGDILTISSHFHVSILEKDERGYVHVHFDFVGNFFEHLSRDGLMPIPPYIRQGGESSVDFETEYQTVFAKHPGAVAAPTAGLHFTDTLLDRLKQKGVTIEYITLHVGYGTFKPVTAEKVTDHVIHEERYSISKDTAKRLTSYKQNGKRLVAVGTTSVRTLESAFENNMFKSGDNVSTLFIYPGYTFKAVGAIVTNFHLPQSSLLMLVSAFSTVSLIRRTYEEAIMSRYRFYSFGDAMLLL
jgi:S-adenosylmethionine:tRNA ribosyltransferase-isomerase